MNIYVSHLSWGTKSDSLQNLFSQYGEVSSANVITDRETGRSRGFGFVEMPNETEGQAAIDALDGTDFEAALPADRSVWPHVDIFIPTYNESLDVIKPTVYAALNMDWPADKLHVYVLDDGSRDFIQAFAEAAGAGYIKR